MASIPDNSTPLATAKTFLAGIKARDKKSMRAGKPLHMAISDVLNRLPLSADILMDELSYDEVEHMDGDFATVWTPYKFYEDGKLHHTGSNNFCLWNSREKGWIITAVQDIARPAEGVTNLTVVGGRDVEV
ncbi:hypothetical protein LTR85_009117 [Meristemomyces frigidus]|nr:hypothetical protein LTR85_009117 [Meristemomyces frigidus]